jgi:hypothetical protein
LKASKEFWDFAPQHARLILDNPATIRVPSCGVILFYAIVLLLTNVSTGSRAGSAKSVVTYH